MWRLSLAMQLALLFFTVVAFLGMHSVRSASELFTMCQWNVVDASAHTNRDSLPALHSALTDCFLFHRGFHFFPSPLDRRIQFDDVSLCQRNK
jgi:hypothetical protein